MRQAEEHGSKDQSHPPANTPQVNSQTTTGGVSMIGSFVAPPPDIHPDFTIDPAHVVLETPTAMDQFHQIVGGVTLVH